MKKILFSVVMSVYHGDDNSYFEKSVDSLLNQTYAPSEIIIVIDGKVDKNLQDSINKYKDLKNVNLIYLNENLGLANALNIGIAASKYDIIARMDSDDICFRDRFEKQIKYLIKFNLDIV
jgi:glycosyltransferase involved in cell wall biosynthesis